MEGIAGSNPALLTMVQQIVINTTPTSLSRLSQEAIEWISEHDYTIGENLQANPDKLPARDHDALVDVVSNLGFDASMGSARLKVVEIPDGVEWTVTSKMGREIIEEDHRVWS